jgi:hypothetical protein
VNGWVRGPAVQLVCMLNHLRPGDQVIVRVKHTNNGLNNKVCNIVEVGKWDGTYMGKTDCTYIAAIKAASKRYAKQPTRYHAGDLGVIAEDIVAWRRPQ